MNHPTYIFLVLLIVFSGNVIFAQPPSEELETEEVEIIRNFEANLEETEKFLLQPDLPDQKKQLENLNYNIPKKPIQLEYPAPKIRPIAMRRDQAPPVYNGWLKAGYGTPNSPYAELGYNFTSEEKLDLGIKLKHHSANRKALDNQRFMINTGKIDGTYFFEEGFALNADLGYTQNQVHLYGYDHEDTSFTRKEVERNINTLEIGGRFFNSEKTVGDLNYYADADFYLLRESFLASRETGVKLDFGVTKFFDAKHPLSIKLITDFTTFKDTATQNLHNFYLQPNFTFHGDQFMIRAGFNLVSSDDDFRLFPDIEASVAILGSQIGAFIGWNGTLQKNSFRNLIDYNPFVASRLNIGNTSINDYYGGVKGRIANIEYRAQVGYKNTKDLALFLANQADRRQFDVLYDTVNIFYLKGTISYTPIKELSITASLGQNFFDTRNVEKAWGLPAFESNVTLAYTPTEKVRITAELFLQDDIPFLNTDGESINTSALFDINLGGEYFFSKNIGAFLQFNNLADNQRERWQGYPMIGINIIGGIMARF